MNTIIYFIFLCILLFNKYYLKLFTITIKKPYDKNKYQLIINTNDTPQELVNKLFCPITHSFLIKPVITNCNHIFSKKELLYWLKQNDTCPLCRSIIFKLFDLPKTHIINKCLKKISYNELLENKFYHFELKFNNNISIFILQFNIHSFSLDIFTQS